MGLEQQVQSALTKAYTVTGDRIWKLVKAFLPAAGLFAVTGAAIATGIYRSQREDEIKSPKYENTRRLISETKAAFDELSKIVHAPPPVFPEPELSDQKKAYDEATSKLKAESLALAAALEALPDSYQTWNLLFEPLRKSFEKGTPEKWEFKRLMQILIEHPPKDEADSRWAITLLNYLNDASDAAYAKERYKPSSDVQEKNRAERILDLHIGHLRLIASIQNDPKAKGLAERLETDKGLYSRGKPKDDAKPSLESIDKTLGALEKRYSNDYAGWPFLVYMVGVFSAIGGAIVVGVQWNQVTLFRKEQEDRHKKRKELQEIVADLSTVKGRGILYAAADSYYMQTQDAETTLKFLDVMREDHHLFLRHVQQIAGKRTRELTQELATIDEVIGDRLPSLVSDYAHGIVSKEEEAATPATLDLRFVRTKHPFSEIRGYDALRDELRFHATVINNAEDAAKQGVEPTGSAVFHGHPGTGKTSMAVAYARSILEPKYGIRWHEHLSIVSGGDLLSKWMGESEQNIKHLFDRGRKNAPYVIVLDEGDSLLMEDAPEWMQGVVNEFKKQMGANDLAERGVYVLLTMNTTLDDVDLAMLRHGRIEHSYLVDLPDEKGREQILDLYLGKLGRRDHLSADFDIGTIAERTEGYAGADLKGLVTQVYRDRWKEIIVGGVEPYNVGTQHFLTAMATYTPTSKKHKSEHAQPQVPISVTAA
ncbi:ATP-binding protein [Candidatus Woesearchaeota archaeon]|nr:ATP-binding protein [Candidatus Woesearchaeota archaeon]